MFINRILEYIDFKTKYIRKTTFVMFVVVVRFFFIVLLEPSTSYHGISCQKTKVFITMSVLNICQTNMYCSFAIDLSKQPTSHYVIESLTKVIINQTTF